MRSNLQSLKPVHRLNQVSVFPFQFAIIALQQSSRLLLHQLHLINFNLAQIPMSSAAGEEDETVWSKSQAKFSRHALLALSKDFN